MPIKRIGSRNVVIREIEHERRGREIDIRNTRYEKSKDKEKRKNYRNPGKYTEYKAVRE
jgi:hypothetical protein